MGYAVLALQRMFVADYGHLSTASATAASTPQQQTV
jgi:hypothetical protein